MKIWTLRHKSTGRYMPNRMFKQAGKGWSYWNPHEDRAGYLPHDQNPRVFFTLQSARNAKAAWCAGEWNKNVQHEGWESGYAEYLDTPTIGSPAAPRNRDDLEIVEGELVLP